MHRTILYLEKGNRSTIIHYINNEVETLNTIPERYLNNLCLLELTTLRGRIEAVKANYHILKNVPIYIKNDLVLFPTHNSKSLENIYVNSVYIKLLEEINEGTLITFYDNQSIMIKKGYQSIKTNYEKCIKIKNKINQYH